MESENEMDENMMLSLSKQILIYCKVAWICYMTHKVFNTYTKSYFVAFDEKQGVNIS